MVVHVKNFIDRKGGGVKFFCFPRGRISKHIVFLNAFHSVRRTVAGTEGFMTVCD